jgi:hypothetical protein
VQDILEATRVYATFCAMALTEPSGA